MDGDVDYRPLARRQAFQSSSLPQTRNLILQEVSILTYYVPV